LQFTQRIKSCIGPRRHRSHDGAGDLTWNVLANFVDRLHRAHWHAASQQFIHQHAERVLVGAPVDFLCVGVLFGRHVIRGAEIHAGASQLVVLISAGDAEVHQLDDTAAVDPDVFRLEIPVNDEAMCVPQCLEQLLADCARFLNGKRPPARQLILHATTQADAAQPLHRKEVTTAGDADVEHSHDVRMRQLARDLCFGDESRAGRRAIEQLAAQYLDRDFFVLEAVAGSEYPAHAAVAKHGLNFIPALEHDARADHHVRALMWLLRFGVRIAIGAHHGDRLAIHLTGSRFSGAARHLISADQARQILLRGLLGRLGFGIDELVLKHRQAIRIVLP
jgi:hypothetical protein